MAARALQERGESLTPGLWALGDRDDTNPSELFTELSQSEGFRVVLARRQVAVPEPAEQAALARFLVLMFTRSPKIEAAATAQALFTRAGVLAAAQRLNLSLGRSVLAAVDDRIESARWVGLRNATEWSEILCGRHWWLVRAADSEGFIIGDSPVVAGLALGLDTGWLPLVGDGSVILAFPLSPRVALLVSGPFLPAGDVDLVAWINRTSWRWADEQVAADSRRHLEAVLEALGDEAHAVVEFPVDPAGYRLQGATVLLQAAVEATRAELASRFIHWYAYRPRCRGSAPGDHALDWDRSARTVDFDTILPWCSFQAVRQSVAQAPSRRGHTRDSGSRTVL